MTEADKAETEKTETNLDTDDEVGASLSGIPGMSSGTSGNLRTVYVFVDLPIHYEFRAGLLPLLPIGSKIVFDPITVRDTKTKHSKIIEGPHVVTNRIIRHGSRPSLSGLTQYLEVEHMNK